MSTSTFHRSFKEVTAMSPLQYQKTLRLSEAQRLMLTRKMDAARASFEVGYVSSSQFSREYRRQFGTSPISHIATLKQR
jgi:AraC-like DNA-binding protein